MNTPLKRIMLAPKKVTTYFFVGNNKKMLKFGNLMMINILHHASGTIVLPLDRYQSHCQIVYN